MKVSLASVSIAPPSEPTLVANQRAATRRAPLQIDTLQNRGVIDDCAHRALQRYRSDWQIAGNPLLGSSIGFVIRASGGGAPIAQTVADARRRFSAGRAAIHPRFSAFVDAVALTDNTIGSAATAIFGVNTSLMKARATERLIAGALALADHYSEAR